MSFPRAEFEVDTLVDRCDATEYEVEQDDPEGTYVSVPVGKCGGDIKWATEQVSESHYQKFGKCEDCGAYYTYNL